MLSLRVDLFIHNPDESAVETKLNLIIEALHGLSDDPATVAKLAARVAAADGKLQKTVADHAQPGPGVAIP